MLRVSLKRQIRAVRDAASLRDAAAAIAGIGKALGLDRPGFVEDFSGGPQSASQQEFLGPEWMLPKYQDPALSADRSCPVFRACRVSVDPFVWHVANIVAAEDPTDCHRRTFRRLAANNIVGGVTVPVHLPKSRLGAVGWLSADKDLDLDAILANHGHEMQLAGHLFMGHVFRRRPDQERRPYDARLTERELECLTWVALGKTDSEIGELIGRASSTARFHVESAIEKLGVNNRARAAAVACQMGLINALA